MLTALIATQLLGIQNETTKINAQLKYGRSRNPQADEFAAFVFIMFIVIGSFIWPAPIVISLWRKNQKAWSVIAGFLFGFLFLALMPFYLLFGFFWSVIRFTMKNEVSPS